MIPIPLSDLTCSRASHAWREQDGRVVGDNVIRTGQDRQIVEWLDNDRVWYDWPDDLGFMAYDYPGSGARQRVGNRGTTHWLPDIVAEFESATPYVRLTLGQSYEGRPIYGYRLGSSTKPHFIVTSGVHGDEADGMRGQYKAMELLATLPEFQHLRDKFCLFFVPIMNPDGYYHWERLLREIGDNGRPINLNRVWDNYWAEYVPTASESKGDYLEQPAEAQAFLQYLRTANNGGRIAVQWAIDIHATKGPGKRYQSNERYVSRFDTDDFIMRHADFIMWRNTRAIQRHRVAMDSTYPDLYTNYFRSRYRPMLHAFMRKQPAALNGGIAPFCMAMETAKIDYVAADPLYGPIETDRSACCLNLDYVMALGELAQAHSMWQLGLDGPIRTSQGVLVEGFSQRNDFLNADWESWSENVGICRPAWWNWGRAKLAQRLNEGRMIEGNGAGMIMEASVDLSVPAGLSAFMHMHASPSPTGEEVYLLNGRDIYRYSVNTSNGTREERSSSGWPTALGYYMLKMTVAGVYPNEEYYVWPGITTTPAASWTPDSVAALQHHCITIARHTSNMVRVIDSTTMNNIALPAGEMQIDGALLRSGTKVYNFAGAFCSAAGPAYVGAHVTELDLTTDTATRLAVPYPLAVYGLSGVSVGSGPDAGKLLLIGGTDGATSYFDFRLYDPTTGLYADVTPAVVPTALAGGISHCNVWWDPINDVALIIGGRLAGGTFSAAAYEYDLATQTITQRDLIYNSGDDQDTHDVDADSFWEVPHAYCTGATTIPTEDDGFLFFMFMGGVVDDTESGTNGGSGQVYLYDQVDDLVVALNDSEYGYYRSNTKYRCGETEIWREDYDGVGDLHTVRTGFTQRTGYVDVTSLPATITYPVAPTARSLFCRLLHGNGAGTRVRFHILCANPPVTEHGYCVEWNGGNVSLYRYEQPGTYVLLKQTAQAMAGSPQTWDIAFARDVNGGRVAISALLDDDIVVGFADWTDDRIVDVPIGIYIGVDLGSLGYELHDLQVNDWFIGEKGMSTTWNVKNVSAEQYGHFRISNTAKDDMVSGEQFGRRARTYYGDAPRIPHRTWASMDFASGRCSRMEDGLRAYIRVYKDGSQMEIDGPLLDRFSKRNGTYVPEGYTRAAETVTVPVDVAIDAFRIGFTWLPSLCFAQLEEDLTLVRLSNAAGGIRLYAAVGDRFEREFNLQDIHSTASPTIVLEKTVTAGAKTETVALRCLWGGYGPDTVGERFDDPLTIEIWHKAGQGFGLLVRRGSAVGEIWTAETPDAIGGQVDMDIVDGGWFSNIAKLTWDTTPRRSGRGINNRASLNRRNRRHQPDGAVIAGDLDPVFGENNTNSTFKVPELFDRANNSNMGTDWDIITQTGNGWNIESAMASCAEYGAERFDNRPGIREAACEAEFMVEAGAEVGILFRLDYLDAGNGMMFGYLLSISSTGNLTGYHLYHDGTTQQQDVIYTAAVGITAGVWYTLRLECTQDNFLWILNDNLGPPQSATFSDVRHYRAGCFGMVGQTSGPGVKAWCRRFQLYPLRQTFLT